MDIMRQKELEVILKNGYKGFTKPLSKFEQYDTPINVATDIVFRAYLEGNIEKKEVVDLGSGPGVLGIAALLLGAESVTFVETDNFAVQELRNNLNDLGLFVKSIILEINVLDVPAKNQFDTCLMNPPFGLQQKKVKDIDFLSKALQISKIIYSIHDGTKKNLEFLKRFIENNSGILASSTNYRFNLDKKYWFHNQELKEHQVVVLKSQSKVL